MSTNSASGLGLTSELIEAGKSALARSDWAAARKRFEAALAKSPSAEAYEGLAQAAAWLHDGATATEARERAMRLYLDRNDAVAAARAAMWLALDVLEFCGESAVAEGWLHRARRLIEDAGAAPSAELANLTGIEGHFALMLRNDTATAARKARQAYEMARSLKLRDIETLALGLEGLASVSSGRVAAGLRMLDEAGAALISGEVSDATAAGTATATSLTPVTVSGITHVQNSGAHG
jgi:tetratricopeptide (TPR) repeat protein